ncbi:MAG: aminotransferase class IV [Deltaproteobacteria bacterium]|nr:aminotransferase class IV [Deltaproteobacteria bacterium]
MLKERIVYLDGTYAPWDEAKIHMMSHSVGRGSAIFEVIGFHETATGPAVFRLDEYVARFRNSAALLEMEPPLSAADLQEAVLETIRRNGLRRGVIKMMGLYPEIAFKILPPLKRFRVAVFVFDPEGDFGEQAQAGEGSVTACVSKWRRLDPQTIPIEAKVAANYMNGIVARAEARNLGFDYAILLDAQGCLAEGGTESLFLVREGRLVTPSLGTILKGITRKTLLEVAETMGIGTFAGRLDPGALQEADEIFFAATTNTLLPVRQVGDRILKECPGPVTRRLAERMAAITSGREAQFHHWLFGIDRKMFGGDS